MPIMDGYEACDRIHKEINEKYKLFLLARKVLIYALTADVSDTSKRLIKNHPFINIFDCLSNDREIQIIKSDIKINN